jgi:hypothetical protein
MEYNQEIFNAAILLGSKTPSRLLPDKLAIFM